MDLEVLAVLLGVKSLSTVWAKKYDRLHNKIAFVEGLTTYFALILPFVSIVVVYVQMGCSALGTNNPFRNGIAIPPLDRPDHLVVLMLVVGEEKLVIYFLKTDNFGKLINLELLVFRTVGIVEFPLTQRDVLSNEQGLLINNTKKILIK